MSDRGARALNREDGRGPLVIIPAFNEEESIGPLLAELRAALPQAQAVVISDGSTDETAARARAAGAVVLDLPCNRGVGGAVQAGFLYARAHGHPFVVRIDGDGQHPPAEIPKLLAAMAATEADLLIGSRFVGERSYSSTRFRYISIRFLAAFLSLICRSRVTDPTSGFWLVRQPLLDYFAHFYPTDYPEPEALALLRRQGYSYQEVPVLFRPRLRGRSSIRTWGTLYYAVKVGLALVVDRIRPLERRFIRSARSRPA